jgi:hypothetical protein
VRQQFAAYYGNEGKQVATLWTEGLFVFDTSVLLGLYRYPEATTRDLLTTFRTLVPRVWIPHQVALEYQENRLQVIYEQAHKYFDARELLEKTRDRFKSDMQALQLTTRHSFIDAADFVTPVEDTLNKLIERIEQLQGAHPNLFAEDYIRTSLDEIFDSRVGPPPESQADLDRLYLAGRARYEAKRPPGFSDSMKSDEHSRRGESIHYFAGDMRIERQFGDLIAWQEMLSELRSRPDIAYVAFVTDDYKEDWWWKQKQPGRREARFVGARPELVNDVLSIDHVQLFEMYRSDSFLEAANLHLDLDIHLEAIAQVKEVTTRAKDARDRREEKLRHSRERMLIHKAFSERGPEEVWQTDAEENVFMCVVQLSDGRYGIIILEHMDDGDGPVEWQERTSFVPRDGEREQVWEYVSRLAHPFRLPLSQVGQRATPDNLWSRLIQKLT